MTTAPPYCPWCGARIADHGHDDNCPRPADTDTRLELATRIADALAELVSDDGPLWAIDSSLAKLGPVFADADAVHLEQTVRSGLADIEHAIRRERDRR